MLIFSQSDLIFMRIISEEMNSPRVVERGVIQEAAFRKLPAYLNPKIRKIIQS